MKYSRRRMMMNEAEKLKKKPSRGVVQFLIMTETIYS